MGREVKDQDLLLETRKKQHNGEGMRTEQHEPRERRKKLFSKGDEVLERSRIREEG
jgi:hypothetical protein